MKPEGSRIAIIFNGSPLFTGNAGGGESNIRKWIIENDWLEAIIALPTELFYNTGIATYIWIVTNKKPERRKGKVQLINAVGFYEKMRKSLGNKRNYISDEQIQKITEIYTEYSQGKYCKIFDNREFGYTKVTIERPLVKNGVAVKDRQGKPKPDTSLRDYEKVPLKESIEEYFKHEVLPHVPDAWMDRSRDKVGYEISFTKYFYEYKPLRSLEDIRAESIFAIYSLSKAGIPISSLHPTWHSLPDKKLYILNKGDWMTAIISNLFWRILKSSEVHQERTLMDCF